MKVGSCCTLSGCCSHYLGPFGPHFRDNKRSKSSLTTFMLWTTCQKGLSSWYRIMYRRRNPRKGCKTSCRHKCRGWSLLQGKKIIYGSWKCPYTPTRFLTTSIVGLPVRSILKMKFFLYLLNWQFCLKYVQFSQWGFFYPKFAVEIKLFIVQFAQ